MTGFGKASVTLPGKKLSIELKSLNSKQSDINLRLPALFRSRESDIRQILSHRLERGKIDCNFYCEVTGVESISAIKGDLVKSYLLQLKEIAAETGAQGDLIGAVMRLPDVLQNAEDELEEDSWKLCVKGLEEAIAHLNQHRQVEGKQLAEDLRVRLDNIGQALIQIEPFEADRRERAKGRLQKSLAQLAQEIDQDRFEQELIYYLEKYDLTEEKVRLRAHLNYFGQLLEEGGAVGKKLGFVSQEIGREINTLGSKANHAALQRLVVEMKDELEKIKEQVLNLL